MTKEALESMIAQINGGRKPALTVDHDLTYPPAGKILEARIQEEEGEFLLIGTREFFEKKTSVKLPDGSMAWKQESETDRTPFAKHEAPDQVEIYVDSTTFGSFSGRSEFFSRLRGSSNLPFVEKSYVRKAFFADPQLIFTLTNQLGDLIKDLGLVFLAKKVVDKAGDKLAPEVAEDVVKLYKILREAIVETARNALPKNRPVTYIINFPGNPALEFVARTRDVEGLLSSLQPENQNFQEALLEMKKLSAMFQADKVQFLLSRTGKWRLTYVLTATGGVIGKPHLISKRDRRLEYLQSRPHGMSVGGGVVEAEPELIESPVDIP